MTELVVIFFLLVVILGLIAYIAYRDREDRRERSKLLNAILSKNNDEFTRMEVTDKIPVPKNPPVVMPEPSEAELDDNTFMDLIKEGRN